MVKELAVYVEVGRKKFPRVSTREELEELGARHLRTDNFKIGGIERAIEYMVIEEGYAMVWKKNESNENYELHLLAQNMIRFPNSTP
jgi:hypothetical protein